MNRYLRMEKSGDVVAAGMPAVLVEEEGCDFPSEISSHNFQVVLPPVQELVVPALCPSQFWSGKA